MSAEYVFRFLSVRPADSQKKIVQRPQKVGLYTGFKGESALSTALGQATGKLPTAVRVVTQFRGTDRYIKSVESIPFNIRPGLDWVEMNPKAPVADSATISGLEAAMGGATMVAMTKDAKFQDALGRLADTLLAETVVPNQDSVNLDRLSLAHKLMIFVTEVASGFVFPEGALIGEIVGARTILVSPLGKISPARTKTSLLANASLPKAPPAAEAGPDLEALAKSLADLKEAHTELSGLATRSSALVLQVPKGQVLSQAVEAPVLTHAPTASTAKAAAATRISVGVSPEQTQPTRPVLSPESVKGLSAPTKRALSSVKLDTSSLDVVGTVALLERQIGTVGAHLASKQTPQSLLMMGKSSIDLTRLASSLGVVGGAYRPPLLNRHFCDFKAGIGDLLIVRQKLKAYELAEFAATENVLAGETREREHRRLDTSEDITTTETTTDTQKEKDLQSTQRNEMQTAADKTVKQQFGLEAGLQVSGSYGPTVQFAAHLNANYSTSTEETQKKAISFSQEVTSKSSESIRQTIKQSVTHRVMQEIQEINRHSFVNSSPDKHIRGIYRWLNKVYDAQIYNYGQRMMYEFVVPEPAAYFLYAMVENPPPDSTLIKPEPPMYYGAPLKPANLDRANYHDYVAKYYVTGVTAPPAQFQNVAFFDKQDGDEAHSYGRAGKIDIPDGYQAYAACVMSGKIFIQGQNNSFHVMLGARSFDQSSFWGPNYKNLDAQYRELSVSYLLMNVCSFAMGVDVYCQLTDEAFAKWQQSAYDSIIAAYLRQKADYEEKVAAREIQNGPADLGQNPAENLRITKDELKKLVLMILTGSDSIGLNSFEATDEPNMDLEKVCVNGSWIRFFENAFEWTNLVYVLYPYFWGRHARWSMALHLKDPDPDFAAFLRAGAARVQIPVRPGFEKAVAYFCQYGEVWEGNDPPLRNDDLYVPIVDEISANLGKFTDDGVPYPEGSVPWEVRIPTELVLVENVDEVPNIVDMLTGNPVTLHS
jgi:hypothetical protein